MDVGTDSKASGRSLRCWWTQRLLWASGSRAVELSLGDIRRVREMIHQVRRCGMVISSATGGLCYCGCSNGIVYLAGFSRTSWFMRQARGRIPFLHALSSLNEKHSKYLWIWDITCRHLRNLVHLSGVGFCYSGRRRKPLPESVLAPPSLSRCQLPPPDDSNVLFLFLILNPARPTSCPSLYHLFLFFPSPPVEASRSFPLSHLPPRSVAIIESAPLSNLPPMRTSI